MNENKGSADGEKRKYIRYACRAEFKAIIDFNADVARRATGRFPTIVFHPGEKCIVRDISEKGISIETDHVLPEGMILKMAMDNPITPPIQTGARIVWTKELPDDSGGYVMGLTFRYMREKHRRNLEELLEFLKSIPG
jgi:hypothetical protein